MKTLKLLLCLSSIMFSIPDNVIAQNAKSTDLTVINNVLFRSDMCGNEINLLATLTLVVKTWDNGKMQTHSTVCGTDPTGAVWEGRSLDNQENIKMPGEGFNATWTYTTLLRKDGKPYGIEHMTYHITTAPDGKVTAELMNYFCECGKF